MSNNPWVQHVKKTAAELGVTYACAITEASKTYVKQDKDAAKKARKEAEAKKTKTNRTLNAVNFIKEYKKADKEDMPLLTTKYKRLNEPTKLIIKEKSPRIYNKLEKEINAPKPKDTAKPQPPPKKEIEEDQSVRTKAKKGSLNLLMLALRDNKFKVKESTLNDIYGFDYAQMEKDLDTARKANPFERVKVVSG